MKKLTLALAITAFSGFASADDLNFEPMGTISAAESCEVSEDFSIANCSSPDFLLEDSAYTVTIANGSTTLTDTNSLQGQARGLAQLALTQAITDTGVASDAYDLAGDNAQDAEDLIDEKQGLEDTARDEYISALSDSQADPTDQGLQQTAVEKAQDYLDAVGVREQAQSDGALVLQAEADALEAFNSAQDNEAAAGVALDVQEAISANSFTWTNALQGAVDQAQNLLDADIAASNQAATVLGDKQLASATAQSDQIVADNLEDTTLQDKIDAEAALTAAISAYEALDPNVDAPEDIQAAATLITTKSTESANAATAYDEAVSAALTASAAVTDTASQASAAQTGYDNSLASVLTSQSDLEQAQADQEVHNAYLDNEENPANALMDQLVDGDGYDAQAVVVAVSDLYDLTEDNADDVEANTVAIEGNDTDIAANATAIAGNDTDIAANVSTLAVHEGLVTQNIADIASNDTDIAANVATLAIHEGLVTQNIADISANQSAILTNQNGINANSASITQLDQDLDVVRSGVAAALAASSIPMAPGQGWGAGIGTGFFDGESAIAAGLSYRSESYNFKFSVGNSGGETSASAGAAWNF